MSRPALYRGASRVVRSVTGNRIRSGPAKGLRFYGGDTVGYQLGISEPLVQQALVKYLKAGDVLYDVGAHAGFMALLGGRIVGSAGAVIAFDPITDNLALLVRNVAVNHDALRCEFHPLALALSDQDGKAMMVAGERTITASLSDSGDHEVETARLDSVSHLRPPSLVKIDVEGAEIEVLAGARRTLAEHLPVVVVEIHGDREGQVRQILSEIGYASIERLEDGGMPHLVATR